MITFRRVPDETSIDDLTLGTRAKNCLVGFPVENVGELRRLGEPGLLRIPHLGRKTLKEISEVCGGLPREEMDYEFGVEKYRQYKQHLSRILANIRTEKAGITT